MLDSFIVPILLFGSFELPWSKLSSIRLSDSFINFDDTFLLPFASKSATISLFSEAFDILKAFTFSLIPTRFIFNCCLLKPDSLLLTEFPVSTLSIISLSELRFFSIFSIEFSTSSRSSVISFSSTFYNFFLLLLILGVPAVFPVCWFISLLVKLVSALL